MAKRTLSPTEASDLRQTLHVAVLEALVASRRWEPGDLVFQGGTSLHLVHGSPRFSEDLDFLVKSTLDLDAIGESIQARLGKSSWIPRDARLTVTKAKDGHNPHAFDVTIGGPAIIGSVRVKVELWQTPAHALKPLTVVVKPVRLITGPAAGAQAFVPAAAPNEIYADKVFAVAARPYLKPRDVFDLHWLLQREPSLFDTFSVEDMRIRLATYPNETPAAWLDKAHARLAQLPGQRDVVARDLARWLPSSWPIGAGEVDEMVATTCRALADGVAKMEAIRDQSGEGEAGGGDGGQDDGENDGDRPTEPAPGGGRDRAKTPRP